MVKDGLKNVAVYFNDEYIGEITSFNFEKGTKKGMALLRLKGKYQASH